MDLGLSEDEFWSMSPRQYDALRKRYKNRREYDEFMLAQIASACVNFSFRAPKKPIPTTDFMLSRRTAKTRRKRGPSQKNIVRALNMMFGVTFPPKENNG